MRTYFIGLNILNHVNILYTHQVEGLSRTQNTDFGGVSVAVKYEGLGPQIKARVRITARISLLSHFPDIETFTLPSADK